MTDPWWWAAIGGAVGAGGALPALLRLVGRILRPGRKTDTEVKDDLRDALVVECARLRDRIEALEQRADRLQVQLIECEKRSAELTIEGQTSRLRAEELARRVGQLEGRT